MKTLFTLIVVTLFSMNLIGQSNNSESKKNKKLTAIPIKKKVEAKNLETLKVMPSTNKISNDQSKPILYTEPKKK